MKFERVSHKLCYTNRSRLEVTFSQPVFEVAIWISYLEAKKLIPHTVYKYKNICICNFA